MSEEIRRVVSVADLPAKLRQGFDPTLPVELVQSPKGRGTASQRLRARMAALTFKRVQSTAEAVERVRRIRDGGPI
jgi:hypothetical protein